MKYSINKLKNINYKPSLRANNWKLGSLNFCQREKLQISQGAKLE